MSEKFYLGAIDMESKEYTLPRKALKGKQYVCIECDKRVILRQGKIRAHHFAHFSKTNNCSYYEHPNEAQIHKDAKLLMQKLLNEKRLISFTWDCNKCGGFWGLDDIPSFKYKEGDEAVLEYRGPNGSWIADVALINNNQVRCIIEIKNKHETTTSRPEPWFEVDANELHKIINEQLEVEKSIVDETAEFTPPFIFEIPCIRRGIDRKCYGSFCYKESWVKRIPGHSEKNKDNSCILCKRMDEYIPTFDGCTGKFQDGSIRVCQDCLINDTYEKQIRKLYSIDIQRNSQPTNVNQSVKNDNIVKNTDDILTAKEKTILEKIPKLWKRFGSETQWRQELPCSECKSWKYSPFYYDRKFYTICKICFSNETVQNSLQNKINNKEIKDEECLIVD